jgi:hypothetical protein
LVARFVREASDSVLTSPIAQRIPGGMELIQSPEMDSNSVRPFSSVAASAVMPEVP